VKHFIEGVEMDVEISGEDFYTTAQERRLHLFKPHSRWIYVWDIS
jgi:hypothetical protein